MLMTSMWQSGRADGRVREAGCSGSGETSKEVHGGYEAGTVPGVGGFGWRGEAGGAGRRGGRGSTGWGCLAAGCAWREQLY